MECSWIHRPFASGLVFSGTPFPLTPALSQGERAGVWLLLDKVTRGLFFCCVYLVISLVFFIMGYPTKVQLIQRKQSQQWYINFPAAIAQGMDFAKGEAVQWTIADKGHLILSRNQVPPNPIDLKKTLPSSKKSSA